MPPDSDSQTTASHPSGRSSSNRSARSWLVSVLTAAALTGAAVGISSAINPLFALFERIIHWDWMAVLAALTFLLATLYLRKR